jgi:hypothetical protein
MCRSSQPPSSIVMQTVGRSSTLDPPLPEKPLPVLLCLLKGLQAQNGAVTVPEIAIEEAQALPPVGLAVKPQFAIDPAPSRQAPITARRDQRRFGAAVVNSCQRHPSIIEQSLSIVLGLPEGMLSVNSVRGQG